MLAETEPAEIKASTPTGDPWLLTPGPITTTPEVKQAMLHDYGSRDHHFIHVNSRVREMLVEIVRGGVDFTTVPLQGSGTFVVEAMIGTFVPPTGKLLILVNGAYGHRIARIAGYHRRAVEIIEVPEDRPVDPVSVERALAADAGITHVVIVHCETTTGILNPVAEVAEIVKQQGRRYLIDSMSAFGALPLDSREIYFDAAVASSNKCLEGVPGMGFCIARKSALDETKGNAPALTLDLYDQWVAMEKTDQWRFTPPVQVIAAFHKALEIFVEDGGVEGRYRRYVGNCRILVNGMRELGFQTLLPDDLQAPIIVTFLTPRDPRFDFQDFYDRLRIKGFVIYPGKLTVADTFRMGCIGAIGPDQINAALDAVRKTLDEMGVIDCAAAAELAKPID
jgi:2-aminoethylphosphonate-pyruvate transaminase